MNWVFWALILIAIAFIWATCTNAWVNIGNWLEDTINNMKSNDEDEGEEN